MGLYLAQPDRADWSEFVDGNNPAAATATSLSGCWEIDRDPWECPHFPTRKAAEAERTRVLAEDGEPDGPLRQLQDPCVVVTCGCGAYELGEHDYPSGVHFASLEEAIKYACEVGMTVDAGTHHLVFDPEESKFQAEHHRLGCASLTGVA